MRLIRKVCAGGYIASSHGQRFPQFVKGVNLWNASGLFRQGSDGTCRPIIAARREFRVV